MNIVVNEESITRNSRRMMSALELTQAQLLWRAVLAQSIRDIYSPNSWERKEVVRWLATPDFDAVCDMACVEVENMRSQMTQLIAMPEMLAKKYGKMLRDAIMDGIHSEG